MSLSIARRSIAWTLVWFAGALAAAQVNLEVTVVRQETRAAVEGAVVFIENDAIGYQAQARTNRQGKARFLGLSTSGRYDVTTPGDDNHYAASAKGIELRANFTQSVTLALVPLATQQETLTVIESGFARLNAVNAEVSSTLTENELETLPVEGRDLTRALYRLPNVSQATGFYPEAPNVSVNGANSLFTNYMIDGMDNNENFLGGQKFPTPVGIARSVTVLTNNYSTEFGRTGNGVFNITTKSGGNFLAGEAFTVWRPGPELDASSPYAQRDLSGNQVRDGFSRLQAGFSVGGPILRDKTFYFFNVERTDDDKDNVLSSPSLGVNDTVTGTNDFSYLSGKIDHYWSPNWQTSFRANVSRVAIERQGGGLTGGVTFPSAGNEQDRDAHLLALRNTYIGGDYVYEGNLQHSSFRWNYGQPFSGAGPQVSVLDSQGLSAAVLGHPGFIFDSREKTWQLQQKLTFVRERHTFKVGLDLISADFSLAGGGNVNGNYLVQLTAAQEAELRARNLGADLQPGDLPADVQVVSYGVELQPNSYGKRQNLYSFYAEDLFSVNSRLNLTFGLRYDYDNISEGGGASADSDNIAPRFSFNYALDERSVIRGGYGLFYEKLPYAIYSDALQQNSTAAGFRQQLQQLIDLGILPADTDLDQVTFDGNLTVNPENVAYLQGPTPAEAQGLRDTAFSNERRILNPNGYDNPRTHQISLGYQRQLGNEMLFYVDLMHTRSFDLLRLRNLNAPSPYSLSREQVAGTPQDQLPSLVRSQAEADATRPVAPIPGGARNIVVSESGGESRYSAANFNLVKDKGEDAFAYRLSYTLSRLRNNTEDINFRAEDSNDFADEWGPSINDRTHLISAVFYYYPTRSLSLSMAALLQTGQPINRIPDAGLFGTTDLNGDGRSFGDAYVGNSDRFPGESRNSDRLPWSETFDLGLGYNLDLWGQKLELRADIFNLFNATNLSGYANNATQSNQIQVGPANGGMFVQRNAAPPRQFQFSGRWVF